MAWQTCSHPLLLIHFNEQNGIIQNITLSNPNPNETNSHHPYVALFHSYLQGNIITWPPYNASLLTPYQREVFAIVLTIPHGELKTYKEVALLLGNPHHARAVAQALKHNPFPLVIPCHRVVSSAFPAKLGGYTPHPHLKQVLLHIENAL